MSLGKKTIRLLWIASGTLSLIIGFVGIFLPLLPTTPFLLLTAFCFGKSSPRLHRWLLEHKTFGPPVRDWNERRVIRKRAKWIATVCIAVSASVPVLILPTIPLWARLSAAGCSSLVLLFIWMQKSE
jgi:uncharacterized membrane protein YbaN (DUF454 family)